MPAGTLWPARVSGAIVRRDSLFVAEEFAIPGGGGYDVFPNGREFVMLKQPLQPPKLHVLVNWQQMIGKAAEGRTRQPDR